MHPILEKCYKRCPRIYGFAMLSVGVVLALCCRRSVSWTFLLIILSTGFGAGGLLLLILGAKCFAWDARWNAILKGHRISMWEALVALAAGAGLLVASALVWRALP